MARISYTVPDEIEKAFKDHVYATRGSTYYCGEVLAEAMREYLEKRGIKIKED